VRIVSPYNGFSFYISVCSSLRDIVFIVFRASVALIVQLKVMGVSRV